MVYIYEYPRFFSIKFNVTVISKIISLYWDWNINKELIEHDLTKLGPISPTEKKKLIGISLALVLWKLDFIHGIGPAPFY